MRDPLYPSGYDYSIRLEPSNRLCTSTSLSKYYLSIYRQLYSFKGRLTLQYGEQLINQLIPFSEKLYRYLLDRGLSIQAAYLKLRDLLEGGILHTGMQCGLHLAIDNGAHPNVSLLIYVGNLRKSLFQVHVGEEDTHTRRYILLYNNDMYWSPHTLLRGLNTYVGTYNCVGCHYSDDTVKHCGLGLPMLIPHCSAKMSDDCPS
jgi:hypothetical protein